MNHITTCPVLVFCQRMSLIPSPLKSPVSKICQGLAAVPGEPPPITVVPRCEEVVLCAGCRKLLSSPSEENLNAVGMPCRIERQAGSEIRKRRLGHRQRSQ